MFVLIPTLMAALYILRHLGTLGAATSAGGVSAIGGVLYGLVRVGRWYRNVRPPEPKARRAAKELYGDTLLAVRGIRDALAPGRNYRTAGAQAISMIMGRSGQMEPILAHDHGRRPLCLNAKLRHNGI